VLKTLRILNALCEPVQKVKLPDVRVLQAKAFEHHALFDSFAQTGVAKLVGSYAANANLRQLGGQRNVLAQRLEEVLVFTPVLTDLGVFPFRSEFFRNLCKLVSFLKVLETYQI